MISPKHFDIFKYCLLFLFVSEVRCDEKSSLTFVIDDTGSMQPEIDQVKDGVNRIFDAVVKSNHSQIENFILVTFNDYDPDPAFDDFCRPLPNFKLRISTKKKNAFKNALANIDVACGGSSCPEYSMSGIMEGINQSLPKSIIYVFTDASAKDYDEYEKVKNLAVNKQSKVIFVLTGYCYSKISEDYMVYQKLADATSGDIFEVEKHEIKQIIPDVVTNVQGRRAEILYEKFPSGFGSVTFNIDNKNKDPTIKVTGYHPSLIVFGPDGREVRTDVMVHTSKVLIKQIPNASPGDHTAIVTGTRVKVTARTEVIFNYGFSTFEVSSIESTTKIPLPDVKYHIYIKVTDGNVKLQTVKITDGEEIPLTLLNENDKLYYTKLVIELPSSLFKLTISGYDPYTNELITRTGFPIEPQPRVKPEVKITQGEKVDVNLHDDIKLSCEVSAYPAPKIEWTDADGKVLPSNSSAGDLPNKYISYLNVSKVSHPTLFYCNAGNDVKENSTVSKKIKVDLWFEELPVPTGNILVKYGEKQKLTCDVKSSYPQEIKWQVPKHLTSSDYELSVDKKFLTIYSMSYAAQGWYECTIKLKTTYDKSFNVSTILSISNLAPPSISITQSRSTVLYGETIKILCKITAGVPRPSLSWKFMRKGDSVFKQMSVSGQKLIVDSATFADAGQYQCHAENGEGHVNNTIDVTVQKAPEASIDEGIKVVVMYGSTNVFKCRVVAYPPPTIEWRDSEGQKLDSEDTTSNYEKISQLNVRNIKTSNTYSCNAKNDLNKTVTSIQVLVLPPIEFITQQPEITSVKYHDSAKIICDVNSNFSMRIKWFYQKNDHSKLSEIHTSANYLISSDNRILEIMSTDLDLVGKYTCEASLVDDEREKKSFTTKVEINNLMAPEITDGDKTVTVMVGQRMSEVCKVNGIPKPDVSWEFKSLTSNVFTAIPDKGEQLIIPKIGYEYAGSYKCTATNNVGTPKTRTIDVVVHGEPQITNVDSAYFGVTGDKVLKIPCNVTGIPEPTITWKNGDKYVNNSDAKIAIDRNALFINNPTEKDTSNFTCEARNKYGYATKQFVAIISDFINTDEDKQDLVPTYYLKSGESANIECRLPHSDPQSVRWYVNHEKTEVLGTFYSLKNVKFSNDGNYTCRLNTKQGSESQNYVVDVGYEPSFSTLQSSTIIWNGNKEDVLDCHVNAKPKEEIQWFYNGKLLNNNNTSELYITNWGAYTCKASNVHGSVQLTFNVTSDGCLIDRAVDRVQNTPLIIGDEPPSWPQFDSDIEFLIISRNQIITLRCSTLDQTDNTFKTHPNDNTIRAECYNEDKFIVDGKTYKFEELQCQQYVRPSRVFTKKPCMHNGEIMEVGFKLDNGFLGVYEVCYSEADHKTFYTKVVMTDANIGNLVGPSFKLNQGIKTGKQGDEIIKCRYNQRWLVKPEDVAFGPAQIATLSEKYNAVPVYEPCEDSSRLSWSNIEDYVKTKMYSMYTMTVWTGASQFNLQGIPRYLWKVMQFEGDELLRTIVYVNAPNPNSSDILCSNIPLEEFTTNDQYTYSCSMEDFSKTFKVPMIEFS